MKGLLIGVLLASPPVAAWMLGAAPHSNAQPVPTAETRPAISNSSTVRIPVEIVAEGSSPEWVYVEVENQSIPEPGVVSLIAVAGLLLLRRSRPDSGK